MRGTIFINLPVEDVARSTAFYEAIGFARDPRLSSEHGTAIAWSDTATIMLTSRAFFATLTPKPIADPRAASGVLIALAFDSRAEVDAIVEAAVAAGGREGHEPEDLGFMYSRAFEDPDGHGFGPVWMDETAAGEEAEPA